MAASSAISAALVVVAVLVGGGIGHVAAQAGCAAPTLSLTPCLNFVTGSSNGNSGSPTRDCCDAVRNVTSVGVDCFCQIITTSNPLGFINRTLALNIPGLCMIKTQPLNQCQNYAGVPFMAPSPSLDSNPTPSPAEDLAPSPSVSSPATSPAQENFPKAPVGEPGPAGAPSDGIEPSSFPPGPGRKDASGGYRAPTEILLSVIGILLGMFFLW